jgi:hypothetical protein
VPRDDVNECPRRARPSAALGGDPRQNTEEDTLAFAEERFTRSRAVRTEAPRAPPGAPSSWGACRQRRHDAGPLISLGVVPMVMSRSPDGDPALPSLTRVGPGAPQVHREGAQKIYRQCCLKRGHPSDGGLALASSPALQLSSSQSDGRSASPRVAPGRLLPWRFRLAHRTPGTFIGTTEMLF